MKILITAPSLDEKDNVSGISTLVANIFKRSSHELVHFVVGSRDGEKKGARWLAKQAALPGEFRAAIRSAQPDLVHLNTAFTKLAILRDAALARIAHKEGVAIVLHIHGGPFVAQKSSNRAVEYAARRMLETSERSIVFSEKERGSLLARFPGTPIDVLPNGIPLDDIPQRAGENEPRSILFFGRLNSSKGLDHLISVSERLEALNASFAFQCFGAGPEADSFLPKMRSVLGQKFCYGGVVKGRDKWKSLTSADIFLLPSRDEGLPIALLESMAAGCVPVVSPSGAVGYVIEDGENGFLIDADDTEAIAQRLIELLDPATDLTRFRQNASNTVSTRFGFQRFLAGLDAIYASAIAKDD